MLMRRHMLQYNKLKVLIMRVLLLLELHSRLLLGTRQLLLLLLLTPNAPK
jgi:hypothetical protein